MTNKKEKIIEKVIKLFDLAQSNTSKEEMTSALEQARKLLQKYGLTMEEVDEARVQTTLGGGDGWNVDVPSSHGKLPWVIHLAAIVGEYFECKVASIKDTFIFYGPSLSAELSAYGFQATYNQIMKLAESYSVSEREFFVQGALGRHRIKSYAAYCREAKHEYRTGLAIGLEKHLDVLKEEESKLAENAKIGAIVVFSEDIADRWAESENIVIRSEGAKESKRHKVTGTEHCDKGLKDANLLQFRKGLVEGGSRNA